MATRRNELLGPELVSRLEPLSLLAKRPVRGWAAGQRRSRRAGHSVEFLDYRPYGAGDELRYVDWNIFARTGRPVVKLRVDDEELCLHLLVDASASMGAGEPSKLDWARRMAAALGFIGLAGLERVGLGILRDTMSEGRPPARGREQITPLLQFLAGVQAGGDTKLNASLDRYATRAGRRHALPGIAGSVGRAPQGGSGVLVLISDLLDPAGYETGLKALLEQGFEVHLIHVLSPEELDPRMEGELRLIDEETGDSRELWVDGATLARYGQRLRIFLDEVEGFCRAHAIDYHRANSATPASELVLGALRGRLIA